MNPLLQLTLLLWLLLSLVGCRTRVKAVELETLRIEYRDRLHLMRDSIYLHDSVYIERRGDTIYRDRQQVRYRGVLRVDTAYIERRDSISYPVVVEVEKPRPWLQKVEVNAYRVVILLLLIYVGWYSLKKLLWRRRL